MYTKLGIHVNPGPRGGFGPLSAAAPAVVLAVEEGGALLEARENRTAAAGRSRFSATRAFIPTRRRASTT
jgi:hypothetical protein